MSCMNKILGIIGAGDMARVYADKARELGVTTHCFAWEEGAAAKDFVDFFHPISIFEKDKILKICREENITGIVSTTELTIAVCSYLQEKLGATVFIDYEDAFNITNKIWVREMAKKAGCSIKQPDHVKVDSKESSFSWECFPAIVKPASEGGKITLLGADMKIPDGTKIESGTMTSKLEKEVK